MYCRKTTVDRHVADKFNLPCSFSRSELEDVQMASLRKSVRSVLKHSSFYRNYYKGLDPGLLKTPDDLENIALIDSGHVVDHGHELLCISQSMVARVVTLQTSGSTGHPKRLFFSEADLASTRDFFFSGMHSLIGSESRVLVMLPWEQDASVGDLLITSLVDRGVFSCGMWPPPGGAAIVKMIEEQGITCLVGMPHHLLYVSLVVGRGTLQTMLLCSDYAPAALRERIENNCGCETFLHYGSTESGLGGGVECCMHNGCHVRESELLVEIIDPATGRRLPDGESGELVITTIGREAMPLIRYRTGDRAVLDRAPCACGGLTCRLVSVFGRQRGCRLGNGEILYSQEIDDRLYSLPALLDYRAILDMTREGMDRLSVEYTAMPGCTDVREAIKKELLKFDSVRNGIETNSMILGAVTEVSAFTAHHTEKRAVLDVRDRGDQNAYDS